jgi:hypothetical protein
MVFVGAFAAASISIERNMDPYDEGMTLLGADRVAEGQIPYRDFYTPYGPAQFYIVAAMFRVLGHSVVVERVWDSAARALLVVAVYSLAECLTTRRLGLCAVVATLAWQCFFWVNGSPLFPALAAVLISLRLLMPTQIELPTPRALRVAGCCMGGAALFRYDIGLAGCAIAGACITAARWAATDRRTRSLAARAAPLPFLAGFTTILLPVVLCLAWFGALPDLLFDFTTAAKHYVKMRSLPMPGFAALWTDPQSLAVYLPLLICVAATASTYEVLRRHRNARAATLTRREAATRATQTLILTAITLMLCAKGFVRVSNLQMCTALIVATVLLAVLVASWPEYRTAARALIALPVGLALCFAVGAAHAGWQRAAANVRFLTSGAVWTTPQTWEAVAAGPCRMPRELCRMACVPVGRATADTIRYIASHTAASDPIFVGLPRHDKIVANDIALYFDTGRQPATRWDNFEPGLQTSEPIQRQMVEELDRAKPKLVIIENIFQNINEPNGSAVSSGVTILDDYLRRTYTPAARFETYFVMVRAPANGPNEAGSIH